MRKDLLVSGEVYHIFTRSIADYRIFNSTDEFQRMLQLIKYYQVKNDFRFSFFIDLKFVQKDGFYRAFNKLSEDKKELVQVIAYCLMPTHLHLFLKQLDNSGISNYLSNILNGYTRYFNIKHKRKGPLWESRFKSVLVKTDEQLVHLTRYIHLNPVTASLIDNPEGWLYSSYKEFLGKKENITTICRFDDILLIDPSSYRKFVNDQISYQRELGKIKNLLID